MTEGLFIARHREDERRGSFAELRRLGIELAQQFSGELWTDFNLHDPGVTILEQLAYAITELIYRADLPVADLLSGADGIDYRQQALCAPEQIYPSRPSTPMDYRKVLLNTVSELDNCWLQPLPGANGETTSNGLYRILLKLSPAIPQSEHPAIRNMVRACYHRQRNLCEDVAEIVFMREIDYSLWARVEVASAQRPVDILAEIYFNCARRIAGRILIEDYSQVAQGGLGLDQIFNGPFTDKGIMKIEERPNGHKEFVVSTLYSVINEVEGVDRVETLYLERDGRAYYDAIAADHADTALELKIPRISDEVHVVLTCNGRVMPVAINELRARYDELRFHYFTSRVTPQDLSLLYALPAGTSRRLSEYASIQNQFPVNYGIGRYGIPESAAPQVKARARQLKAYLMVFEQIMTNYLANLNGIRDLYSIDKTHRNTYSYMALDDRQITDVRDFYPDPDDPDSWGKVLDSIMHEFDHYHERKSRLLDYLLALYGESFSQNSLRHFDYYYQGREMAEKIIDNKIEYLVSVVELGRDRAKAADYTGKDWAERASSGLHQRVGMLLGFDRTQAGPLVQRLLQEGLKLARHKTYEHLKVGSPELRFIDPEAGELLPLTLWEKAKKLSLRELRQLVGNCIPLNNKLLSDRLLREGVDIGRLHLFVHPAQQEVQLCFRIDEDRYWSLGEYPDLDLAMQAGNALQRLLIHWNIVCEGFHLVEHVLLRPTAGTAHEGMSTSCGADFFSHRISVIFPAWTARCHDPDFRLLAEETVHLNLPAHVCVDFYWLGFHEMYEWEQGYANWLDLKSRDPADVTALDRAAVNLLRFLSERRPSKERDASP